MAKTAVLEEPAVDAAPIDETPTPTDDVVVPPTAKKRRGLRLAAIIVGAVIVAGALFGGGIAVGLAIPGGGPAGMSQGDFPGGDGTQGGPQGGFPGGDQGERPAAPQQQDTDN